MNWIPQQLQDSFSEFYGRISSALGRWLSSIRPGGQFSDWLNGRSGAGPYGADGTGRIPFPVLQSSFPIHPAADVQETDDALIIRAEIPGMEKDEFSVEVRQNRLFLRGEKKYQRESKGKNFHRVECSYGSFSRSFPLPCEVESDKAEAVYRHGVLNIRLPKTEASRQKRITVKVR